MNSNRGWVVGDSGLQSVGNCHSPKAEQEANEAPQHEQSFYVDKIELTIKPLEWDKLFDSLPPWRSFLYTISPSDHRKAMLYGHLVLVRDSMEEFVGLPPEYAKIIVGVPFGTFGRSMLIRLKDTRQGQRWVVVAERSSDGSTFCVFFKVYVDDKLDNLEPRLLDEYCFSKMVNVWGLLEFYLEHEDAASVEYSRGKFEQAVQTCQRQSFLGEREDDTLVSVITNNFLRFAKTYGCEVM
jgi:hypothetical protein